MLEKDGLIKTEYKKEAKIELTSAEKKQKFELYF